MSAQINLYHARFLNVRDWLHLNYVALAAAIVFFLLGIWTVIAQRELHQTQTKAAALLNTLETTKAAVEEATQRTNQPANPQLLAEIAHAQATLSRRDEIVHLLESGTVGNSQGFSTFLSGFARQVPTGLWLTGFTLSSGGANMEIRGSTYDEKTVPEYIRRLGRETLFQGRQFSALSLQRDASSDTASAANTALATQTAVSPAPTFPSLSGTSLTTPRRTIHFVLTPMSSTGDSE